MLDLSDLGADLAVDLGPLGLGSDPSDLGPRRVAPPRALGPLSDLGPLDYTLLVEVVEDQVTATVDGTP